MYRCIVSIVLWIGCSSDVAIEDIDDIDAALEDAVCDREVSCGAIESLESCRAVVTEFDDLLDLQHAVANGTVDFDGSQMRKCVDWYKARSCDRTAESARVGQEPCTEAFRGTVPDGGACMISAQCISQHCDNPSCPMACCEGTCGPATARVPIGSGCMPGRINCVAGSFCNGARVCQALLLADQPCIGDVQCGFGLFCASDTDRCTPARHRGDPCPEGQCSEDGTTCDARQVCVALAGRGDACGANAVCQRPNLCNPATLICEPPPEIGQVCTRSCKPGAYCDATSRCAATKPNGEACSLSSECASNHCDDTAQTCQDEPVCI